MVEQIEPGPGRPYASIVADRASTIIDIPAATIEALYKAHGALLLRGFRADIDDFGTFAR